MDRRTFKNFITKRSSIWTMSLCLTGALTLGGIAWLDNTIRGNEKQQIENEAENELDKYADTSENSGYIAGIDLNGDGFDLEAASGNAVEEMENTGLVNGNLMQEEISGMEGNLDEMTDEQDGEIISGIIDETVNGSSAEQQNIMNDISGTAEMDNSSIASESTDTAEVSSGTIISEQMLMDAGISFSDAETLLWPAAGTILIDYSMDSSVYFTTLNQYKYNPALVIGSAVGNQVLASAAGMVESVLIDEETGTTLVLNIGNGYKLTYGQLKELAVAEGDIVEAGAVLGYVSEPTKYFVKEGSNLYFGMTYEGKSVDPVLYLEG